LHPGEFFEIGTKTLVLGDTVLKTAQIGFEFPRRMLGEAVDFPVGSPGHFDQSPLAQISEVLGDFGLREFQNLLEMTDAKWSVAEEMEDAKAGRIT